MSIQCPLCWSLTTFWELFLFCLLRAVFVLFLYVLKLKWGGWTINEAWRRSCGEEAHKWSPSVPPDLAPCQEVLRKRTSGAVRWTTGRVPCETTALPDTLSSLGGHTCDNMKIHRPIVHTRPRLLLVLRSPNGRHCVNKNQNNINNNKN